MAKLIIKGTKKYIDYMQKHLKKEHPSTKKRMKVCYKRKRKEKDD